MTGRRIRRDDRDQKLMDRLDAANEEWKSAIRERNTAENSVREQRLEIKSKSEGKLISTGDFHSYVLDIVKPVIEYFIAHITGPLAEICKGYLAARCFGPFFFQGEGSCDSKGTCTRLE